MSTEQKSQTSTDGALDETTRSRFEELRDEITIRDETITFPEKSTYKLQDLSSDGQARVNIHNDALADSPRTPGDRISQYYFRDYGFVLLDLNPPRED